MRPRVLVLADHCGYADGVVHGVTTYYLNVLPRAVSLGVALHCCFLRTEHPAARELREKGVSVEFLSAGKWDPSSVRRIEKIARDMQANVLHLFGMKSALLGRWVARRTGASVIIHSHDMNLPPLSVRLLYRLASVKEERGLAVSAAVAGNMSLAYCMNPRNVVVLHNGVDLEALRKMHGHARPDGLPASDKVIAWVGRLHSIKGPIRMLRAMAILLARMPDCHLVIVGDGPERGECEAQIRDLGLGENVHMLGQRKDVGRLLNHSQLLCMSSYSEGFPTVAVEAAVAGIPVVAYSVGGVPEVVVDGETGMLVSDGNDAGLADAIFKLLANEELRRTMAANALAHSGTFSLDRHVTTLVRKYERAASRSAD